MFSIRALSNQKVYHDRRRYIFFAKFELVAEEMSDEVESLTVGDSRVANGICGEDPFDLGFE